MAQAFNLFEDFAPYEEQQFTFNSSITQHQKISSSEIPAPSKKIVDFGKKIGGARKDMFAYWREKFLDYTQDNIARQPFSKTWPMLPYQKLVDEGENPEKVAVLRVIRDLFSDKPRKRYAIPRWATNVFAMRELAVRILNGEPYENALDAIQSRDDLTFQVELYEKFGHKNSFKGFYLNILIHLSGKEKNILIYMRSVTKKVNIGLIIFWLLAIQKKRLLTLVLHR